jgi:23S rRNA (cytosine1962-C5)-methyltransferase
MIPSLKLKANAKARIMSGHPWVFANEVEALLPAECDGEVVECRDRNHRFLGSGIYNSRSQIIYRRLSREHVALDEAYLKAALGRALARRASLNEPGIDPDKRRLVWSEADELPGLVVDQFGDTLVLQVQSLAMEKRSGLIASVLEALLKPAEMLFRNDSNLRRLEGLPMEIHTQSGRRWEPRWMSIDGLEYWMDLQNAQKTGFYLDQRRQHALVARYCAGKRVLDAFCNQGPFALHAARAGAVRVLGLDSAADAIDAARKNAERNRLAASFEVANVFDWMNAPQAEGDQTWDVIVLDPPPFAKSKSALENAMRGYKEINLRAMKKLSPGGILATYTCSHHMQEAELRSVLAEAAADAKRRVYILEWSHQPPDHPVLATMPESEYLRGMVLRVE